MEQRSIKTSDNKGIPALEDSCKDLMNEFKGVLSWKWDSRFETVLAEFSVEKKDSIHAILKRYFSITWDTSSIKKAPDIVKRINIYLGNLRSGQMLFTTDPNRDDFIFCAWWPWGNGKTISVRIAPFYKKLSDSEKTEKIKLFKSWFGLKVFLKGLTRRYRVLKYKFFV